MIDNRYDGFKYLCRDIDKNNISKFKENRYLKSIVDNVSYDYGLKYLDNILDYKIQLDWNKIKKLNDIGSPKNYSFKINNIEILLSPTTLRYVQYTLDILNHIKKDLNINNLKIVEVGGGYGAQSVFLFELSHLFDITIDKYEILDLYEVNNLQKHYIDLCQVNSNIKYNIDAFTLDDYSYENENYFISNYALGELTKYWQNLYVDNVISKIKNGYICWNFSPENQYIHEYFNKVKKTIEEENPQTNCPPVKSYIIKY